MQDSVVIVVAILIMLAYGFDTARTLARRGKVSLTILTNGLLMLSAGLGLLPLALASDHLTLFHNVFDGKPLTRAAAGMAIFLTLAWPAQRLLLRQSESGQTASLDERRLGGIGVLIILCGTSLALYFLVYHRNIFFVGKTFIDALQGVEYYSSRRTVAEDLLGRGVGYFAASTAWAVVLPAGVFLTVAASKRGARGLVMWTYPLCIVLMMLIALAMGHRGPLLWTLLLGGGVALVIADARVSRTFALKGILLGFGLLLLALGIVYMVTDRVGLLEGIYLGAQRIIVVPALTQFYLYDLFPDGMSFRGFSGVWHIPGDEVQDSGDVTLGDIAVLYHEQRFTPNSNFIAVGYSGMGFAGVFISSATVVIGNLLLDLRMSRWPSRLRILCCLCSGYGVISIGNTSIGASLISWGWFVVPAICVMATEIFGMVRLTRLPIARVGREIVDCEAEPEMLVADRPKG